MKVKQLTKNKRLNPFDSLKYQIVNELFFKGEILGIGDIDLLALLAAQSKAVSLKGFCERAADMFSYASVQSVRNRISVLEKGGYIEKSSDLRNKKISFSNKLEVHLDNEVLITYNMLVYEPKKA